jgi:hypothetical protein
LRVFVIWEPVLTTDWGTLSPAITANIADPRALHFWDPGRQLSALLGGPGKLDELAGQRQVGFRMKDVIWDAAFLYPRGGHWHLPAQLLLAPVVKFRDNLAAALPQ